MKLGLLGKIPLLAMIACISMALLTAEVVAFYELAHHDCTGSENTCPVCQRAKAAADFLDTLRIACLFAFFTIFILFVPEFLRIVKEFIPNLSSLITLKVRSNT
jgi:hypothetical protein